ncbi:MAG: shikimate dehydrogenase [Bacteroidetes bacterium]|nr:shikimate dehydrogenase [Bacteroidota bacterium]
MRIFGLIGYPLSHSFSPAYFNQKFSKLGVDAEYHLFPLKNINELDDLIKSNSFLLGLNVTIPYKESVIPKLNFISAEAREVGAVNTILIYQNKLAGFNTDVIGFYKSLISLKTKFKHALVLGTGGSSKAIQFVLNKKGISFSLVSRKEGEGRITYAELNRAIMHSVDLIINCTPVGMHPNNDGLPMLPYKYLHHGQTLIDLIYNPRVTGFLKAGLNKNCRVLNGWEMLKSQAEESWKIWNNSPELYFKTNKIQSDVT